MKERSWTFPQCAALDVQVRNSTTSCVTYSCLWMTQMKSMNTTRMNFSVTFLEKKTKGSFLKPFKNQGGKGIGIVPASAWFDGHVIFQSVISPGRTWRNSVKPIFDETSTIHPVGIFKKKIKIRAASLIGGPPPTFEILKYHPFLFSSSPSSIHISQDWEKPLWKL